MHERNSFIKENFKTLSVTNSTFQNLASVGPKNKKILLAASQDFKKIRIYSLKYSR